MLPADQPLLDAAVLRPHQLAHGVLTEACSVTTLSDPALPVIDLRDPGHRQLNTLAASSILEPTPHLVWAATIASLAEAFVLHMIASGVEHEAAMTLLRATGSDAAHGSTSVAPSR